jgi:UDP-glucose 4-epimerase
MSGTGPNDPVRGRRVLVTGGAGFIGSHLTERLLAAGADVLVVDDLSTGRRENLPASHERLTFVERALADAIGDLRGETFDLVFHLAAAVGVQRIIDHPIDGIAHNVGDSAAVLELAAAMNRRRPCRFLFASSSEVYGKSPSTPFRETDDIVLGPTTAPRWSYGASKALGEHLALAHHRRDGLPVVVARLFNTVGPRQVGDYGMVVPRFVRAAMARRPLTVHGDGTQTRCFCDVRDVVPALVDLLACEPATGGIFNVGADEPISIAGLAGLVNETLGSDAGFELVPYDRALGPNFEDLARRQPDLARVRRAIGFRPTIPLGRTIRDIAESLSASRAEATP